jgi:hypothetical protein
MFDFDFRLLVLVHLQQVVKFLLQVVKHLLLLVEVQLGFPA